jgi:hypothetical protein
LWFYVCVLRCTLLLISVPSTCRIGLYINDIMTQVTLIMYLSEENIEGGYSSMDLAKKCDIGKSEIECVLWYVLYIYINVYVGISIYIRIFIYRGSWRETKNDVLDFKRCCERGPFQWRERTLRGGYMYSYSCIYTNSQICKCIYTYAYKFIKIYI